MTRSNVLRALGATSVAVLAGCGPEPPKTLAIGAKDFTEEYVLGELYAQVLERRGYRITRKFALGGTQVAMEALLRGDIDLYPEYTGTAWLSILKETTPAPHDPRRLYEAVRTGFGRRYDLTWLAPAPFDDSQALATTRATAQRYGLRTLGDVAREAPHLRLGAIPEFVSRADGLAGLKRAYGGFAFQSVRLFDIGLKYRALESGSVDIVVAFGTDPQVEADRLVLPVDTKHVWPDYQAAPVVRADVLRRNPSLAAALDVLAPLLTDEVMRRLNGEVDLRHRDPSDVARDFLAEHASA